MKSSSPERTASGVHLLLALLLALTGCTSAKVREVWRDEAYQGRPKSVLVIAIMGNATVQRTFESEFAKRLKGSGIGAVERFRVLPEGTSLEGDQGRDAVVAVIKEQGFDAVLITRITGRRSDVRDIPGMTITTGYGYPYGSYGAWGGYTAVVGSFPDGAAPTTQGYSHESKFLDIETHLFDTRAEKLIWAVRSELRITGPPQEEIGPYVSKVSGILLSEKFLK
jgi:hypothetical protein